MKKIFSTIVLSCVALIASAANIDGKWSFDTKLPEGKGKRGGQTISTTLDLKAEGDKLTGTVLMGQGKRAQPVEIQNGKIEGDKFSFTTTLKTRKGEQKLVWEGTASQNELTGTRSRDGKRKAKAGGAGAFTAKRLS